MSRAPLPVALALLALLAGAAAAQEPDAVARSIHARMDSLETRGDVTVMGVALQTRAVMPGFYRGRDYQPAWDMPGRMDALLAAIRASHDDGLETRDYLLGPLERLAPYASTPKASAALRADLDLLATEALTRLAFSLRSGKTDPEAADSSWNIPLPAPPPDPALFLATLVSSDTLAGAVAALAPRHPRYLRLREELVRYRALDASGGWPTIDAGPNLAVGMMDPRVPVLRRRLAATGDLSPLDAEASNQIYDSTLAAALVHFQTRLGLAPDGVLGVRSRAELNVPPAARIKALRVNLERGRWVLPAMGATLISVNVTAFQAQFLRDDCLAWSGRAVVGQPFQQTPEFRAQLTYLVLNPSWTVPPQILTDEALPAIRRDPAYLARNGMQVLDRDGTVIDPATVDWNRYDGRTLPYRIVQVPGGDNPLGRVKFVFPNAWAVYLHDTPSRALFQRPRRTFSHGCIRIEQPMALAEMLLDDSTWTAAALDSVVALGKEQTIPLQAPVPVFVLYWTAWAAEDGTLNFRPDVYGRDAAILAALNAPFSFRVTTPQAPPRPGTP